MKTKKLWKPAIFFVIGLTILMMMTVSSNAEEIKRITESIPAIIYDISDGESTLEELFVIALNPKNESVILIATDLNFETHDIILDWTIKTKDMNIIIIGIPTGVIARL